MGVFNVTLRISASTHVEDDTSAVFLTGAGIGKLQTDLRLTDPRGADDHRQRTRNQAATEFLVKADDARSLSVGLAHGETFTRGGELTGGRPTWSFAIRFYAVVLSSMTNAKIA